MFETPPTMAVSGDDISPPDGQLRPHPHLAAVIKWWVSCVWGVAGLIVRRLIRVPPALPALRALPALGRVRRLLASEPGAPPSPLPSPAEPEPSVTCCVLCDPPNANVDVIFVHGLYGSLPNTWKQGQWRSKHKTGPKRIPLKRHVSLPQNNYVNDVNNNAKIHKEPRVKNKNKSEEYCSCDNRYYAINVKKQSDISNKNNNGETISSNKSNLITNDRDNIKEYTLHHISKKELTKRRQTLPKIIGRNISRSEMITTKNIERILNEIMKNPQALDLKINEILQKDINEIDFIEKFLSLNNSRDDFIKQFYEYYMSIKDDHRNRIERRRIVNINLLNMNEGYNYLGDDLNNICDRIEYLISKLNSPYPISEVGYKNVFDFKYDYDNKNICNISEGINENIVFSSQLIIDNIVSNKSEFSSNDVAIKMKRSALNINNIDSMSDYHDCDKVCNSLEECDDENMLNLEDLQDNLHNNIEFMNGIESAESFESMYSTNEPNKFNLTQFSLSSLEKSDSKCLEKPVIEMENQVYSEKQSETGNLKYLFDKKSSMEDEKIESSELCRDMHTKERNIEPNSDSYDKYSERREDFSGNYEENDIFIDKELKNKVESDFNIQVLDDSDQNNAEKCENIYKSDDTKDESSEELCDEHNNSEVSDDSGHGGKSCEVGCGCVCSKCYSSCWPRDWLQVDCPDARVISVNYTSDPYLWRPIWIKERKRTGLQQRADEMVQQLLDLGVGQKPIVWVGHSKGGLFIKQIYTDAYEAYCTSQRDDTKESPETANPGTDQLQDVLPRDKCCETNNCCNEDNDEELTNDNFSVRLETEISDEHSSKNYYEDMSHIKDMDNDELIVEENCEDFDVNGGNLNKNNIDYEEYMFSSKNIEGIGRIYEETTSKEDNEGESIQNEPIRDGKHQDRFVENKKIDENRRCIDENLEDISGNQGFKAKLEVSCTNFNRNIRNDSKSDGFDSDSCDVSNRKAGYDSEASDKSCLWSNTKGFMFYSVPHRGSPLAGIRSPLFARSVELLEISENCASVLALQGSWLRAVRAAAVVVRSFVETARTLMAVLWLRIVSVESADAGVGALCGVGLDHREICKPSSRSCFLYRELLGIIRRDTSQEHPHAGTHS